MHRWRSGHRTFFLESSYTIMHLGWESKRSFPGLFVRFLVVFVSRIKHLLWYIFKESFYILFSILSFDKCVWQASITLLDQINLLCRRTRQLIDQEYFYFNFQFSAFFLFQAHKYTFSSSCPNRQFFDITITR